jgi:hypothetical protein
VTLGIYSYLVTLGETSAIPSRILLIFPYPSLTTKSYTYLPGAILDVVFALRLRVIDPLPVLIAVVNDAVEFAE